MVNRSGEPLGETFGRSVAEPATVYWAKGGGNVVSYRVV